MGPAASHTLDVQVTRCQKLLHDADLGCVFLYPGNFF